MADRERASVLLFVPAGIVVLLLLASIAVDLGHLHLAQMELAASAQAAANDAVTAGLDPVALQRDGTAVLAPARVEATVRRALTDERLLQGARAIELVTWDIRVVDADTVEVRLSARVDHIFLGALPGQRGQALVRATALANVVGSG